MKGSRRFRCHCSTLLRYAKKMAKALSPILPGIAATRHTEAEVVAPSGTRTRSYQYSRRSRFPAHQHRVRGTSRSFSPHCFARRAAHLPI